MVHVRPRRSLSTRFPGWRGGLSAYLPIGGLGFESTRRASSQCSFLVKNTSAATRNCLPRRFLRAAFDPAVTLVPARRPSARLHRRVHGGPLCGPGASLGTSPRHLLWCTPSRGIASAWHFAVRRRPRPRRRRLPRPADGAEPHSGTGCLCARARPRLRVQ